jgi:hypothetical protein
MSMADIEKIDTQRPETDFGDNRRGVIVLSRCMLKIEKSGGDMK